MTKYLSLLLICFFLTVSHQSNAQIRYVKEVATGTGDGSSWDNASSSLQDMIDMAPVVYVAEGIYKPVDNPTEITEQVRRTSFSMHYKVAVYGGFPNVGNPTFEDRDYEAYPTILSGDLLGDDGPDGTNISDNSYQVVSNRIFYDDDPLNPTAVYETLHYMSLLDGFIIQNGNANGMEEYAYGGGVYLTDGMRFKNCTFSNNKAEYGGAICIFPGINNYVNGFFDNCTFLNNESTGNGGAIFTYAVLEVKGSTFKDNISGNIGGGIYTNDYTQIENSTFIGNSAVTGGGVYDDRIYPWQAFYVLNCSFSGNQASSPGAAINSNFYSSPAIKNCILWGNSDTEVGSTQASYSIVEQTTGVYPGTGNLNIDPLFITQPAVGQGNLADLHLQDNSPAIDAGDGETAPKIDGDRKRRAIGAGFDMGAYEVGDPCLNDTIVYVDVNATGLNNGSSWTDAYTDLQSALIPENICTENIQVWVAAGTYKPTQGTDQNVYFTMRNNCAIYGGFQGGETALSQRDWINNVCILSGDLLEDDGADFENYDDNSNHIILNVDEPLGSSALIDGFTIRGARASSSFIENSGAGMFNFNASPMIRNCLFTQNYVGNGFSTSIGGAAISNSHASIPTIYNTTFTENYSEHNGGAIYSLYESGLNMDSCIIDNNHAEVEGGGIYGFGTINVTNSTITNNSAGNIGGGVSSFRSFTADNCTFAGNHASILGGAIRSNMKTSLTNCVFLGDSSAQGIVYMEWDTSHHLMNCSFSGNTSTPITFSNIYGGSVINCIVWGNNGTIAYEGFGGSPWINVASSNLDQVDPLFVNQPPIGLGTTGDLRLQPLSPDIDSGTDIGAPDYDADGKERPIGLSVDKGAYEYGINCFNLLFTFNGNGDGERWDDEANWDSLEIPSCQKVLIPSGFDVIVPDNIDAEAYSITVMEGASLVVKTSSTLDLKK